jgi:hypothetical protein
MRPRRRHLATPRQGTAALLTLAAIALLAACGGASPAKRAVIRSVIASYLRGVAHGDGNAACAHATPSGQNKIVSVLGPELQNFDIYGCSDVVYVTGAQMSKQNRRILDSVKVGTVTIDGSTASVDATQITSPYGSAAALIGTTAPIRLVDSYGVWLITQL